MGYSLSAIKSHECINAEIRKVLDTPGPIFCNVEINPDQEFNPFLTFGRPLEDQGPLLDREILMKNILIKSVDEPASKVGSGSIGD